MLQVSNNIRKVSSAAILVLICAVILLSYLALNRLEQRTRLNTSKVLQSFLLANQRSFHLWIERRLQALNSLATDPALVEMTHELLKVPPSQQALSQSPIQQRLRDYFRPKLQKYGDEGMFLIAPDFTNIASMRDQNLGVPNLVAEQRGEVLRKVFNGEPNFIPAVVSDVPLEDENGVMVKHPPTLFIGSPVWEASGNVIAVLTVRIDIFADYSKILTAGWLGQTGETYAFDRFGMLLTPSRFEAFLQKTPLLQKLPGSGQNGNKLGAILNLRITDPGGDVTKGYIPAQPVNRLPLTKMALSAISGESGVDYAGYRDYRGVRVLGAWLWDDKLGFGMATELDEKEALNPFYESRSILILLLGSTLAMSLLLMGLLNMVHRHHVGRQIFFKSLVETMASGLDLQAALKQALEMIVKETRSGFGMFGCMGAQDLEEVTYIFSENVPAICSLQQNVHDCRNMWDKVCEDKISKPIISNKPVPVPGGHPALKRLVAVPILFQGRAIGQLAVADKAGPYTEYDREFIENVAHAMAPALKHRLDQHRYQRELTRAMAMAKAGARAKSDFMSTMSHELRTPLNAIIGFSQLLSGQSFGELNQKQGRYVDHIYNSGESLLKMVNDILTIANMEVDQDELKLEDVRIKPLLSQTLEGMHESAVRRGVSLNRAGLEELDQATIEADSRMLKQVIINLLKNALKFTPSGGSITLGARVETDALRVEVSDTGIGVPPKDHKLIFEEFQQADTSLARKFQGAGLGLTLCKRMVELHGGKIWVESEGDNTGSRFIFTLPLRQSQNNAGRREKAEQETGGETPRQDEQT